MSEQTKEQRLAEEAAAATIRWTAHNGGDSPKVWVEVVRPLVDERDTLAAEVKRLAETAEHLGSLLKSAGRDLATQQATIADQQRAIGDLTREVARQRARGDEYASGIDALMRRYREQHDNACGRGEP
jgi:chromosome segregation ATPase